MQRYYQARQQRQQKPKMWRSSEVKAAENQMTGPRGQCGEAVHIIDSYDHECGQVYCNRCNEDIGLYLGYHCVLLER